MAVQQVRPGEFFISELGRIIRITDMRQDDFYGSTDFAGVSALTAGTNGKPFDSITDQGKHHTNLTTARRIPGRNRFNVLRVGVHIAQAWGNTLVSGDDIMKLAHAASLKFSINTRLVTEGPLLKYQSGYGVTGSTVQNNRAALTIGLASQASAPRFIAAQPLNDEDDLDCVITTDANGWLDTTALPTLDTDAVMTTYLHGIIEKPITT